MQMHRVAPSKLLARAIAKGTIAKMKPRWHAKRDGGTGSDESHCYTSTVWRKCQHCTNDAYTMWVSQQWLCKQCRLQESTSHMHSSAEETLGQGWTSWSACSWTEHDGDCTTWQHQQRWNSWPPEPPNHGNWSTWRTESQSQERESEQSQRVPSSSRADSRPRRHRGSDRPILLTNDEASYDRDSQLPHGGPQAFKAQQALRQYCLQNHLWNVVLNDDYWPLPEPRFDWKKTLLVLQEPKRTQLIADGIVFFQFRLLRNVKDQNYPKPRTPDDAATDTGERHIFEITQYSGKTVQVHYHRNGAYDRPHEIPPLSSIWDLAKAEHYLVPGPPYCFSKKAILQSTPEHNTALGTGELCNALRKICTGGGIARDITDMQAVHWHRWLQTLWRGQGAVDAEAIISDDGIERVFAYCDDQLWPTIIFAHKNNTYTSVEFSLTNKKWRRQKATREGWKSHHMFSIATREPTSWLRIQNPE